MHSNVISEKICLKICQFLNRGPPSVSGTTAVALENFNLSSAALEYTNIKNFSIAIGTPVP